MTDTAGKSPDQPRALSTGQIVAWNTARYRKAAGMTQAELGKRLGGWSIAAVSAAERSFDGKRPREFSAATLMALAGALRVPLIALFLPPDDDQYDDFTWDGQHLAPVAELLMPDLLLEEGPAVTLYRERFTDMVLRHLQPGWSKEDVHAWFFSASRAGQRTAKLERLAAHREHLAAIDSDLADWIDVINDESAKKAEQ